MKNLFKLLGISLVVLIMVSIVSLEVAGYLHKDAWAAARLAQEVVRGVTKDGVEFVALVLGGPIEYVLVDYCPHEDLREDNTGISFRFTWSFASSGA